MSVVAPSVLIRCDGTSQIGMGHMVRCLALADDLRDFHGCRVAFAMHDGPVGPERARAKGYAVLALPNQTFDYQKWLVTTAAGVNADALVLDVRDDLPRAAVHALRDRGCVTATLDDPSERRLDVDLAFYPPTRQALRLGWSGFAGDLYVGWDWVILRREFSDRPPKAPRARTHLLVTMGGSDPQGMTTRVIEALDLLDEPFETDVLLGPGFAHHDSLAVSLRRARRSFAVLPSAENVIDLMRRADLAVASFGVTAYELAAQGVPAIYLCLTPDHVESATALTEAGVAVSLGLDSEVSEARVADAVRGLLVDPERRAAMARKGPSLVDGRGARRVASKIVEAIAARDAQRKGRKG